LMLLFPVGRDSTISLLWWFFWKN